MRREIEIDEDKRKTMEIERSSRSQKKRTAGLMRNKGNCLPPTSGSPSGGPSREAELEQRRRKAGGEWQAAAGGGSREEQGG